MFKASSADSGTAVTAMASPSALKTSIEYPFSPFGEGMMIDNFHDIAAAESVFGKVASESVSIKFEAHDELSFGN